MPAGWRSEGDARRGYGGRGESLTRARALGVTRAAGGVPARTVHYACFTSLQVSLTEMLARLCGPSAEPVGARAPGKGKKR